jgi:DNA polymerase (family 10)
VREVLAQDEEGRLEAMTEGGLRLDLRVGKAAEWGGLLLHATGSHAHLSRLTELAAEKGVALAGAEEDAIYATLGLAAIPPELREDRGEIGAARDGRLPKLIEVSDMRGALHAHSTWSDGAVSVAEMARAARELGHEYLAITDHSKAMGITGGLDAERLALQMAEIEALNAELAASGTEFRVLRGIECDVLADGTLDLPLDLLSRLDFVIASLHLYQKQDRDTITARAVRAIESGVVHMLAHPTGRILGVRDPSALDLGPVMDAALTHRVALEINAYPDRLDMNEMQARAAHDRGIPISINPDAHRPEHLSLLRYGVWQARRAWLEPDDVINTWPLDRLQAWLPRS